MNRRIGILGGTFDPIHRGHLDLASAAGSALNLSSVWFVPSNIPPHRHVTSASGFHRFAMVALAVAGNPDWKASDLELGHAGPSYTAGTLQRLHADGYAPTELYFVIGADAFIEIATWRHYPALLNDSHFAVVSRPGFPVQAVRQGLPALAPRMATLSDTSSQADTPSIFLIDAPTAHVSSTEIRQRLASARSIAGLVPLAVEQHIDQHGLYSSDASTTAPSAHAARAQAGKLHGKG